MSKADKTGARPGLSRRGLAALVAGGVALTTSLSMAQAATTMTIATFHPRSGAADVELLYHFKELVEERTNGEIEIAVFYGGTLGGERELVEQLRLGTVDLCLGAWTTKAAYAKSVNPWSVPYLFSTKEQVTATVEGRIGEEMRAAFARSGIYWAGPYFRGNRQLTANVEVRTPDDLNGLKVRLPEDPDWIVVWEALNTQPVPIPSPEIFSALQTGVVDAQENPISSNYGRKLWEVQKYVVMTNHIIDLNSVLLSQQFLDGLPEDQRQIVLDAAQETIDWASDYAAREEAGMIEEMKGHGMEFIEPDLAPFQEAALGQLDYFRNQWEPWMVEEVEKVLAK